jgi:PIN domain nuclease of toxin-antitoxin system
VRLLLDTHVVLGILNDRTADLPGSTRALLADPVSEFYVSAASLWEIAIKSKLGKLQLRVELVELPEILASGGIELISINERHVLATANPEPATRDPFDRLLLAQCSVEDLRLVTVDRALVSHAFAAPVTQRRTADGA